MAKVVITSASRTITIGMIGTRCSSARKTLHGTIHRLRSRGSRPRSRGRDPVDLPYTFVSTGGGVMQYAIGCESEI